MVMIFTLVTAVQEKLNEIVDVMKNRIEEEKRRREKEAEEAEKVEETVHLRVVTVAITREISAAAQRARRANGGGFHRWRSRARWSPSKTSWRGKQRLTWK